MRIFNTLLYSSATLTLAFALQARAQTTAVPARNGVQDAAQISEVVVTAQKRIERLQNVPAPVTALTISELRRDVAVRLVDYATQVPGLNLISDREGESQIVIRGITTGVSPNSTVSTYIDDSPYGSSTLFALGGLLTPDLDPSDLQRIEVLRGPQGTLYGASSLGGLLKYVTAAPDLENYAGRAEVDGSAVEDGGEGYGFRGMLNAPLVTDQLGLRISAYDRRDPGYISDDAEGRSNLDDALAKGGHVTLYWRPSQAMTVRLSALVQNLNSGGTSDEDINVPGDQPTYGDLQQLRYADEYLRVRYRLYSATETYDFGFASLTSITSYSTQQQAQIFDYTAAYGNYLGSLVGLPDFGITVGSNIHQNRLSQEVRLGSDPGRRLEWQVGFFFDHERSVRDEPVNSFNTLTGGPDLGVFNSYFDLLSRYTEFAGFGDVTYHFTPKFDVLAGVRYSSDNQHYTQLSGGALAGGAAPPPATSSDDDATFVVTPRYRINPNNMIYARIASGYRPGAPNALTAAATAAGVPDTVKPDSLINYEVGYKSTLWDNKLTLDLSAFYIDWSHIQLLVTFDGISVEGNGGGASSDGVEAAATVTPLRGLTVSGNFAYTDAKLTSPAPGVNGNTGDELPNVPKFAGAVNGDYDFPVNDTMKAFVGSTVRYLGDRESYFVTGSPQGYVRPIIPAYTTVDVRTGLELRKYTLELYIKNVGDRRGFNNITSNALNGYSAPFTASVVQPRTFGFTVSASF